MLKGPHEDLESYLEAVDQLRGVLRFFNSNKSFKSSDGVLSNVNNLLGKAIVKLEDEFRGLLTKHRLDSVNSLVVVVVWFLSDVIVIFLILPLNALFFWF